MELPTVELLQAPRWERVATAVVYALLGLLGIAMALLSGLADVSAAPLVVVSAILVVVGSVVALRAPRVGVRLTDDRLEYFGFMSSRSIPRDAITAVLDTAVVEWRGQTALKSTALWLFRPAYEDDGTKFARYWRWRREGLLRVRAWALEQSARPTNCRT